MKSKPCPCCNGSLLRHIRKGGAYWFCSNCWQEMPDTDREKVGQLEATMTLSTSNLHLTQRA